MAWSLQEKLRSTLLYKRVLDKLYFQKLKELATQAHLAILFCHTTFTFISGKESWPGMMLITSSFTVPKDDGKSGHQHHSPSMFKCWNIILPFLHMCVLLNMHECFCLWNTHFHHGTYWHKIKTAFPSYKYTHMKANLHSSDVSWCRLSLKKKTKTADMDKKSTEFYRTIWKCEIPPLGTWFWVTLISIYAYKCGTICLHKLGTFYITANIIQQMQNKESKNKPEQI